MKFRLNFGDSNLEMQVKAARRINFDLTSRTVELEKKLNYLKEQIEKKRTLNTELVKLLEDNSRTTQHIHRLEQNVGDLIKEVV